jgi:hypothetical protein
MFFKILPTLLTLSVGIVLFPSVQAFAGETSAERLPKALQNIPASAISRFNLRELNGGRGQLRVDVGLLENALDASLMQLRLPQAGGLLDVQIKHSITHDNGDVTVSGVVQLNGNPHQVILTQGKTGAIGEIVGLSGHSMVLQQRNQVYLVNLSQAGLAAPSFEHDVVTPVLNTTLSARVESHAVTTQYAAGKSFIVVDIMMLYAREVAEQYPDGLADTLMNQLVAKANQSFVDSAIDVQLRLVHRQFVDYNQPSNFTALADLRSALESGIRFGLDNGLNNVAALREQYGADIVSMIRLHELNERGVCGVAYFPQSVPDVVINISNVGISGGSNCLNTFTHEIGHNFGAGHQYSNGESVGATAAAGALIVTGKFNTVMSSIGTGDVNRNYKLNRFSNPRLNCAAVACGDSQQADNASAVNFFAAANAGLRAAVSNVVVNLPPPSDPDTDGDGVTDVYDAYPFDVTESADTDNDGVGDNADVFPNDVSEWADFDNDGIGNNADPDDDNDGVPDTSDALPFDATASTDSDGDGVGDNNDQLPFNFQDAYDTDADGVGNRFDYDNDNDGVDDFDRRADAKQQLIVANGGSGSIQAFNLADASLVDTLYQAPDGGITFRSDLIDLGAGQLGFVQFSDVLRLNRHTKEVDTLLQRFALSSNFAVHLLKTGESQAESRLYVSNGLEPSYIDVFQFGNSATSSVELLSNNTNIYRDTLALTASHNLLVERKTNKLLRYSVAASNNQSTVWAENIGLDKPEHLARMADGSILVTNAGSRNVTRFSASGQYSGVFISAGSGGLGTPGCIAVDNSGDIYLCSTDTNQVLKYSGNNSAPLGIFASAESAGLNKPVSIAIVGAPLDVEPFNATNDTDGDGVANNQDAFPLDSSRFAPEVQPEPTEPEGGGGSLFYLLPALMLLVWRRTKVVN